jgi:putative ABC transport system substrate-binding protein
MRRREFLGVVGAAAAWPVAVQAQQAEPMKRIGVLMNLAPDGPEARARLTELREALQQLGWSDGRNVRIEVRGAGGDSEKYRQYAAELVALAPDVILALTTSSVVALQQASRTLPLVFVQVIDPVGSGLVASLARPGGNATGFISFEYAISAKWLELLKEIAPNVTRVAVLRTSTAAAGIGQFAAVQTVAARECHECGRC